MDEEINKLKYNIPIKQEVKKIEQKYFESKNELWLEKYKPFKFCDLLTEEKTNREILTWLKSWDDIVFGSKFNVIQPNLKSNSLNLNTPLKKEIEYIQSKHKIILLAGPPGIGKTTLAKVIAEHCGYETIIVNASDERTSDKLLLRVYDSTQINNISFVKKNKKPTCLILDEIDGALNGPEGKNAIKSIMDFIKNGKVNKGIVNKAKTQILDKENKIKLDLDENEEDKDKINEDDDVKINKNIVRRPIICICNDLYAKVLSVLRKEALVFHIKKASPTKLLQRLKEICSRENLNLDSLLLKTLCEKSNYDIRVCINTLEFLNYNKDNVQLIKSVSSDKLRILGNKDISEGIFDIWSKIFFRNSEKFTFNSLSDIYSTYTEANIINDGIFVNYLKVGANNNKDSKNQIEIANRAKLLEHLSYDDVLNKKINTHQLYSLNNFKTIPGYYAYKSYNTSDKLQLEFPSLLIDIRKNKKNNSKILNSIKDTYNENSHSNLSKRGLVLDYLPYIFQLLQPNLREINKELMNKEEIKLLQNTVNLMYSFGIKFNNSTLETEEDIIFEPDLKKLLEFDHGGLTKYRITPKQKLIIRYEYDSFKNISEAKKSDDMIIDDVKKEEKKNFLFNKRQYSQLIKSDVRFIYKFNEGVTNTIRRSLNINYFK